MNLTIKIVPKTAPPFHLADAEVIFGDGEFAGLKLCGFGIWASRRKGHLPVDDPESYTVTFPARSYSVNGERRSFSLLRPVSDTHAGEKIRTLIIDAYLQYVEVHRADTA
jgi:hypothetical protein